ncbi:ABC transporter substrate-binding protein [Spirochaetia bacterium]|nr:ABC transporter substrate-binding protein [Spirochaetia bacterium]
MKKVLAVGVLLLAAAGMVFAGGGSQSGGTGSAAATATGAFDWKRASGSEITVFMVQHPTQESIVTKLAEFTATTGIKVNISVTPEANYFDQVSNSLSSRSGTPDLFMSGVYQLWDYYTAGNVEDLTAYLGNPSLTNSAYEPGDFVPSAFNSLKWDGVAGHPVGTGAHLAIPLGMELYTLAYNQRAFDKAGITKVPETYDELLAAIDKLKGWNGPGSYAIAVRGARDWGTIHPAYMTTYKNFGATDFAVEGGKLVSKLNSPESVAMNTFFVDMIKRGGSPQWSSKYWYDCEVDFENGQAAMFWDASNVQAQTIFKNMPESPYIKYTTSPTAKAGDTINSNYWIWSMAMNSYSKQKTAAWLFLQYFSSKDFLLEASVKSNNMDPVRTSIYNNADFQKKISILPNWYASWQKTVPTTKVQFTPQPAFFQTTYEWAATLQDLVAGTKYKTIKEGLDALKALQDKMVQE